MNVCLPTVHKQFCKLIIQAPHIRYPVQTYIYLKGRRKSMSIFLVESAPGGRVGSPCTAGGGPTGSTSSIQPPEQVQFFQRGGGGIKPIFLNLSKGSCNKKYREPPTDPLSFAPFGIRTRVLFLLKKVVESRNFLAFFFTNQTHVKLVSLKNSFSRRYQRNK